jgi:hypothetical protein
MISAMEFIIYALISAAVLFVVAGTVRMVSHDGRGSARPPRSHYEDPSFLAYTSR